MKFDDAEYHFLNFATDLPQEAGGTHIGMYLAWLALRGMAGETLVDYVADLRARTRTGCDVLFDGCDGKFTEDEVDADGAAFTKAYYEAHFRSDFERTFAGDFTRTGHATDDFCSIADTWENFDRIAPVLDRRLRHWRGDAPPMPGVDVVLRQALDAFGPFLSAVGFVHDPREQARMLDAGPGRAERLFAAGFPGGRHWFAVIVKEAEAGARTLSLIVVSCLHAVAEAVRDHGLPDYFPEPSPDDPLPYTALLRMEAWMHGDADLEAGADDEWLVAFHDADEIAPKLQRLAARLDATIRPLLRRMETPQGLDAVRCTRPLTASILYTDPFNRLTLSTAEVAGNPRLLELCNELEDLATQPDARGPRMFLPNLLAHIDRVRQRGLAGRGNGATE